MRNENKYPTPSSRVLWLIAIVVLSLNIAAMIFLFATPEIPITPGWGIRGFPTAMSLSFGFLGAMILNRYPMHRVGWLFSAAGLIGGIQAFFQEYSFYALFNNKDLVFSGEIAAWIINWIWVPLIINIVLMFFLYPNGELPSPKWRPLLWFTLAISILLILAMAFSPGPLESSITTVDNPFGWESRTAFFDSMFLVSNLGFVGIMIGATAALGGRYRNSQGIERQQLKWLVFAVALMAVFSPTGGLEFPWHLPFMFGMIFLPVAAALAIFRYRLYDIDIIIRRTLSYAVLTGILAGIYFVGVVGFQSIFRGLTGNSDSPLITVISTLTIAALFNPLRIRVQQFIDRRFYRAKYNAERTLEAFAAMTRDEVDMDRLTGDLLWVVEDTMQPETLFLMIKSKDQN